MEVRTMSVLKLPILIGSFAVLASMFVSERAAELRASFHQLEPIAQHQSESINLRLRISWGGGVARRWTGSVKFRDASIEMPTVLGINTESSAGIKIENHAIRIKQIMPSTFEGIEVDVLGHADSVLQCSLVADDGTESVTCEVRLLDLISSGMVYALDDQNNRVSFTRAPGDQIQFRTDRKHLVFDSGETFAFKFRANCLAAADRGQECQIEIVPARSSGKPVLSTFLEFNLDKTGSSHFTDHMIPVPAGEGVYDLRFIVGTKGNVNLPGSTSRQPIRTVQFVVLETDLAQTTEPDWQPVAEIDPKKLRSAVPQQLNQLSRMIGFRQGSIGNYDVGNSELPSVSLPVGGWQAIALDIEQPGLRHMLEIDYDAGQPSSLGFSILEADESGQIPNFGFDSGVSVPDSVVESNVTDEQKNAVHRFSFWPASKRVYLLVANRDQKQPARYRTIRLLAKAEDKAEDKAVEKRPADQLVPLDNRASNRRLMSFYEQPLISDNFGVHDLIDPAINQSINDWVTFYEGTRRLIEHLKDTGASGAFINEFGEGSALMPLESTLATPRYDSGIFASSGSDVIKKDVVELIYRMFERAGLQFVPVVSFDHRLSRLEFSASDARVGSSVVDYRGIQRTPDDRSDLPVYNPLDPVVQETVTSIISEIAERYSNRNSYSGIAIACRPDTCTLLPGSRVAGYDSATLARYSRTGTNKRTTELTASDLSTSEMLPEWLAWRCEQMENWYRQLAQVVSAGKRRPKLYISMVDILRNEEIASLLSPSLHRSANVADAMFRLGFSDNLAVESNNIVLMKPNRLAPIHPLATRKSEYSAQRMRQLDDWFNRQHYSASMFSHRSSWARFENLEGSAFFASQTSPIMRLQQLSPAGFWNRERFAKAVLNSDAQLMVDGGLLLNSAVDSKLKAFLDVYTQLPDEKFANVLHSTHEAEIHPVAVRYLHTGKGTVMYLVNGSPWEIDVTVKTEGVITNDFKSFGRSDWLGVRSDEQPGEFQLKLAPFELLGGTVVGKTIRLENFSYKLPETAHRDLNAAYYKLRSKLIASGNAQPLNALQNPGFESEQFQYGWTIGGQAADFLNVVQSSAFEGESALEIDNQSNRSVWIRSNSFVAPVTGRLSVSVWLKTINESAQPPLRISIESSDPGSSYYRFAEVGSLTEDQSRNQLNTEWKRFAVHFDDLPQDQVNSFRVGFDLIGNGKVWIDQVQVYDRWMDENDVKAMTQMLASIGPLLQETEKLERCRQVLTGYWPTFLREYFDAHAESVVDADASESFVEQPVRSTMRQRFRRFVSPGIFQFR